METLVLSFDNLVPKGYFLDDKTVVLLWSKNLHISKGVNPRFWSNSADFIRAQFFVKETLVLSVDDFVFDIFYRLKSLLLRKQHH